MNEVRASGYQIMVNLKTLEHQIVNTELTKVRNFGVLKCKLAKFNILNRMKLLTWEESARRHEIKPDQRHNKTEHYNKTLDFRGLGLRFTWGHRGWWWRGDRQRVGSSTCHRVRVRVERGKSRGCWSWVERDRSSGWRMRARCEWGGSRGWRGRWRRSGGGGSRRRAGWGPISLASQLLPPLKIWRRSTEFWIFG